jgi:hypothetical protein
MDGFLPGEVSASPAPAGDAALPALAETLSGAPAQPVSFPPASANTESEQWYFLYAATLDGSGNLYGIQGWARSTSDLSPMINAVGDMVSSLRTGTSATGD